MFYGEKSPPVVQRRTGARGGYRTWPCQKTYFSLRRKRLPYVQRKRKNKGVKEKKLFFVAAVCSCCCFCVNDSLDIDKRAITCRFLLVGLKSYPKTQREIIKTNPIGRAMYTASEGEEQVNSIWALSVCLNESFDLFFFLFFCTYVAI